VKMILNADDFGYSDPTVEATIKCFEIGALTSATIMPKMPATDRAIAYAKSHPEFSFGAHLTFCSDGPETCLSPPEAIPSLALQSGQFKPSNTVRRLALCGQIPVSQIAEELRRQLGFLKDHNLKLSHVDSHGHLHKFGPFRAALEQILPQFSLNRVRNVQDVYVSKDCYSSPTYWLGPFWRRKLMRAFRTTDHLYLPASTTDALWPTRIASTITRRAKSIETLEIGLHPGYMHNWWEDAIETIQSFAAAARALNTPLISWNDI
jgi:chitin disaccharide deacetylase